MLAVLICTTFAFQAKVNCKRKAEGGQTSTAKFYTWYFWTSTPPCTSKPLGGTTVSYYNYVYNRMNATIVEIDHGTCPSDDVK